MAPVLTPTSPVFYAAKLDTVGAYIPLHHRRRAIVVAYRNGRFDMVVTRFTKLADAEKRASYLNAHPVIGPSGQVL